MSTNISKKKRDDLLDKIKQIRAFIAAAPQDENTRNLLSYLSELEKDVNGKKYGLVFEEHREEIDEVLDTHTPVLTEEADLFIDHGGQMNFLLEGDNLAALKLLEKTHRGKIGLIYIDPPYNTGNKDFIYDDAFVDKNDCFTHSKWLSFMEERLKTARRLLNGNGVIFISIDDREEAGLRLLCDEIFGENCFVSNIAWQRNYSARNDSKGIVTEVEHLLVYSRSESWSPKKLPRTAEMDAKYKNPDNDFAMWRTDNAYAADASTHQGMVYMKTILLVPLRDYYQSRKRIWVKYLIPVVLGLLALAGALIFNIGNEETIRSTFSEFVNVQINVVAILVSFSVAIISILVTADNANIKSLKEEMADSTQYKPVGGKHLSLFQILLSNIAYNVIVEIIYLVILIGIALIRPIIPLQALKYVAAVCIFAIMHILGVLLESVAQMYLTFWRNR